MHSQSIGKAVLGWNVYFEPRVERVASVPQGQGGEEVHLGGSIYSTAFIQLFPLLSPALRPQAAFTPGLRALANRPKFQCPRPHTYRVRARASRESRHHAHRHGKQESQGTGGLSHACQVRNTSSNHSSIWGPQKVNLLTPWTKSPVRIRSRKPTIAFAPLKPFMHSCKASKLSKKMLSRMH